MSKSLGVLTLDLIAKTGGFESGMDRAARVADKKTREIERQARERAKAIEDAFTTIGAGIAGAFAGIQISDTVRQFFELEKQIQRSAAIANVSARQVQVWTAATKSLGIEQDKLSDIFKDVDDKVGDFTSQNAGPVKDFMESWGKQAGITAEQLKSLAGPDVLQLVMKTMQQAGASTSEVTFMMEALASDASLLTPILKDNAAALREAGDRAQGLGLILSDETLAGMREVRDGMTDLQDSGAGWVRQLGSDLVPALVELKRNTDAVWTTLDGAGAVMDGVVNVSFKALASAAIVASKSFEYAGNAIGGTLAALSLAAQGEFSLALGVLKDMDGQLAKIDQGMSASVARIWTGGTQFTPTEQPARNPGKPGSGAPGSKTPKGPKATYTDPMADEARVYADLMQFLAGAQATADTAGQNLTATQKKLVEVMGDPAFYAMPESWRLAVVESAEYALQAEKIATEQARLNELLAATPTAQLEAQRSTMQFLAQAFEQGRITAEQFNEAASAALGNVPKAVELTNDKLLDMSLVANDAANLMAQAFGGFFTGQKQDVKSMLADFMKATAQMIAQATILKALKGSTLFGGLFADGGAFGGTGQIQAFANGGAFTNSVVSSPTLFKFANGGSFKTGVMGEAGPEAILPLKRGADGKLGVIATGAGHDGITVNIAVDASGATKTDGKNSTTHAQALGEAVKAAVVAELVRQKRPGGLLA